MNAHRMMPILGTAAGGLLAVGLGVGAALAATPGIASADDFQISIDGTDLFPTAGNTATATSGSGDIAIAIGNDADANATGGIGDFAFADGANSTAEAGWNGSLDSAWVFGANSTAESGFYGGLDSAWVFGANSTAESGFSTDWVINPIYPFGPSEFLVNTDFDLAAVFGDGLHATATAANFLTDILPSL